MRKLVGKLLAASDGCNGPIEIRAADVLLKHGKSLIRKNTGSIGNLGDQGDGCFFFYGRKQWGCAFPKAQYPQIRNRGGRGQVLTDDSQHDVGQNPADSGVGDLPAFEQFCKLCEAYEFIQVILNFIGQLSAAVHEGFVSSFPETPESGIKGY